MAIIIVVAIAVFFISSLWHHYNPPTPEEVQRDIDNAKNALKTGAKFAGVTTATTVYKLATTKEKKKK